MAASVATMVWTNVPTRRARCSSASWTSSSKKRTVSEGSVAAPRPSSAPPPTCRAAPGPLLPGAAMPACVGGRRAKARSWATSGSCLALSDRKRPEGPAAATCASSWATSAALVGLVSGRRARWTTWPTVAAGRPAAAKAAAVAGPVRTHIGVPPASARASELHAGGSATTGSSGARRICQRNREARLCPTGPSTPGAGRLSSSDLLCSSDLRPRSTPSMPTALVAGACAWPEAT